MITLIVTKNEQGKTIKVETADTLDGQKSACTFATMFDMKLPSLLQLVDQFEMAGGRANMEPAEIIAFFQNLKK